MKKTGQINLAYAGGGDTTGIPMRGQVPIYANNEFNRKWLLGDEGNKTMYNSKLRNNFWNANSYRSMNNNSSTNNRSNSIDAKNNNRSFMDEMKENNEDINRTFYKRQKSFSDFNRNLTMKSTNPNGIKAPQNYQQTIKEKITI